jgi:hypothetical protein
MKRLAFVRHPQGHCCRAAFFQLCRWRTGPVAAQFQAGGPAANRHHKRTSISSAQTVEEAAGMAERVC